MKTTIEAAITNQGSDPAVLAQLAADAIGGMQAEDFNGWLNKSHGPLRGRWTRRKSIKHLLAGVEERFRHHFWQQLKAAFTAGRVGK